MLNIFNYLSIAFNFYKDIIGANDDFSRAIIQRVGGKEKLVRRKQRNILNVFSEKLLARWIHISTKSW